MSKPKSNTKFSAVAVLYWLKSWRDARRANPPVTYSPLWHTVIAKAASHMGMTEPEIAGELGTTTDTVREWEEKYPRFAQAIAEGRAHAARTIEQSLN